MVRYVIKYVINTGYDYDFDFDDFELESQCYEYVIWYVYRKNPEDEERELDVEVVVNNEVKKLTEVLEEYGVDKSKTIIVRNELELYVIGYSTKTQSFLFFVLEPLSTSH